MNIYFVNKNSKLKGPYDIRDYLGKKITKIGDICIRDTDYGLSFLIVVSSINKWTSCKCVGVVDNKLLSIKSNSLLFSFNGYSRRVGNINYLREIMQFFNYYPLISFFENALEILQYKRDFWDLEIFKKINELSPFLTRRETDKTNSNIALLNDDNSPTIFVSFLKVELRDIVNEEIMKGKDLHEIYCDLRKLHPKSFRQSLVAFLKAYPKKSIYDKNE